MECNIAAVKRIEEMCNKSYKQMTIPVAKRH
jgi:hypothetical protein